MSSDPTEILGGAERRRAREMSLKRGRPPTQVPGYEPEQFLGLGAYGEVWVAAEKNTSRRVTRVYDIENIATQPIRPAYTVDRPSPNNQTIQSMDTISRFLTFLASVSRVGVDATRSFGV